MRKFNTSQIMSFYYQKVKSIYITQKHSNFYNNVQCVIWDQICFKDQLPQSINALECYLFKSIGSIITENNPVGILLAFLTLAIGQPDVNVWSQDIIVDQGVHSHI